MPPLIMRLILLQEIQNNRSGNSSNNSTDRRGEGDGEPALPMSPILQRVIDSTNRRKNHEKYFGGNNFQKSYVDLPHATLDLSGGGGEFTMGGMQPDHGITKQHVGGGSQHNSLERTALELSTLV